jgi:hypothetical protein
MSPGERLDPELDRRDCGIFDVVPLLGVSRLETRLEVFVVLLRCSLLSEVDLQGCYARHGRRVQDNAFLGLTKFRHLSSMDGASMRGVLWKLLLFETSEIG